MGQPTVRRSLFGRTWAVVSPARSERPHSFSERPLRSRTECHFCEGNEAETEREVFALRADGTREDGPGWTMRVVPNKFPALLPHLAVVALSPPPLQQRSATGYHEVVIETPDHERRLGVASAGDVEALLAVYQSRARALSAKPDVRTVVILRNEGKAAGASQEHPHSQILALPFVSGRLQDEMSVAARHFQERGACLTCDLLAHELSIDARIIARNEDFVALASFAPRFAFETWIVPVTHEQSFLVARPRAIRSMADLLSRVLSGLESLHGAFPYNMVLQSAPVDATPEAERSFHWRLEILPRLTTPSGLELGLDVFIVAVTPEQAAARLRAAQA